MSRLRLLLLLLIVVAAESWAQSSTTTTLTVSSASVASSTPVTLTATVKAGSKTITPGLVRFCSANATTCLGPAFLAQAQLVSNGTASIKLALPVGTHSIKAEFAGTKTDAASNSSAETVTVTGARSSSTSLTATASSPYTLTATVIGSGRQAVTGDLSFVDASNGNYPLGTAALRTGSTSQNFIPRSGTVPGSEPVPLAVGDFNGDGYPDFVLGDVNPNSNGQSTLAVLLSLGNGDYNQPVIVNLPSSVSGVSALAVGDFNNDGKLDLAIASGNANSITILLGDGQGDLNYEGNSLPTGTDPNSIAIADFNGDGNADLAVTNQFSSSVTVLLGNGQGGFSEAPSSPQTGSFPYSIAAADFNGDGKPDLAVANYYGFDVTVLLGNGDGTFAPTAVSPAAGVYPDWIAAADFNGDGKQDLAVVNAFSKTVTILLGDGKGDFTATPESPATGLNPDSATVADFNGDGIEDLAVANSNDNTVMVFLGKGDGTFPAAMEQTVQLPAGTAPYSVTALDYNADGFEDFVVAGSGNNSVVLTQNAVTTTASAPLTGVKVPGGGTHKIVASYPGNGSYGGSSANVYVAATPIATSTTLTVEPSGTVAVGETVQVTAVVSPTAAGSLIPTGTVSLYHGTQLLTTVPVANGIAVVNLLTITGTESLSAKYSGDMNFVGSASGTVSITAVTPMASATTLTVSSNSVTKGTIVTLTATVKDNGQPVTQGIVTFCKAAASVCDGVAVLGTAHLNAGGTATIKLALAVGANSIKAVFGGTDEVKTSSSTAQTVTVTVPSSIATATKLTLSGTAGTYTLTAALTGNFPPPTGNVSFVDTSNKNLVLSTAPLGAGIPGFTQSAVLPAGNNPQSIVVADFNGDGKPDLAVADPFSNDVKIYLGNGGGAFTAVASPFSGITNFNQPYRVVAGDFNGDGKPDLVVSNTGAGNVIILLGKGDGTFTVESAPNTGGVPFAIAVADFNGDGKLDLAVTNRASSSVNVLLGNGDGTFTLDPVSPATGGEPVSIVTADFNGDGKADLAVANTLSNNITILLGTGDGTFNPAASPATGDNPVALAVADFSQDGVQDLAVVNFGDATVSLLIGKGDGTFTQVEVLNTGTNPQGILAADLNGDGTPDIAITNAVGSSLTLVLSSISGSSAIQTVPLATHSGPIPIASGDFNQDGGSDLVIGDTNADVVRVLLNSSLTTYATASNVSVPGSGTHEIEAIYAGATPYLGSTSTTVAATGTPISTTTLVTAPNGVVGQNIPITMSISPLSADSFTVSGTVSLYKGTTLLGTATLANGRATFNETLAATGVYSLTGKYSGDTNFAASTSAVTPMYVAPASTTSLAVSATSVTSGTPVTLAATVIFGGGAVTQGVVTFYDGSTQLATAELTSSGSAVVKQVLGIGTHSIKAVFAATTTDAGSSSTAQTITVKGLYATTTMLTDSVVSGTHTLAATVTGAGTKTPSGSISFLNTTANTTLGTATLGSATTRLNFTANTVGVGAGPQGVAVADFNRDGNLDLAISNTGPGTLTIQLGDGKGTFTAQPAISVGNGDPDAIAVGDFNADGIPDLAIGNFNAGTVSVLLGAGNGTFIVAPSLTAGANPFGLAVGDFNLDGKLDLAVTNGFGGAVSIFLGQGNGRFAAPTSITIPVARGIAVGDFNGDGKPDLAVTEYYGETVHILLGQGNGSFVQSARVPTGNYPGLLVVGDFNGDGKLDMAVTNKGDGTLTVALGNGDGTFGAPSTIPLGSGTQPQGLMAADFNQDGKLDLAVTETGENQIAILLGNGNGTFTLQPKPIPAGSQPWAIASGDFNNDGEPDFAVPNSGSSNVSVVLDALSSSATATLSGATISGTSNQNVEAKYAGSTLDAASISNTLSLPLL